MALEDIIQLLSIPSTADNPVALKRAVDFVQEYIAKHPGITVERFESKGKPSLLAYAGPKRPEKFKILLNGHLDVVTAKPEQFTPLQKDGKLFGRGALDMKAAALVLADVFCELAPQLPFPLGLQIVCDEEIGGHNGTKHQLEQGVQTELLIAGEFTPNSQICIAGRGICTLKATFKGKAAHGAYVWDGDNAALKAARFVNKVIEAYPLPAKQTWTTTINIASIATPNETLNRVPDLATVDLDCRYIPDDGHFASEEAVRSFILSLNPDCELKIAMFEPAQSTDEQHPLLQQLAKSLEKITGQPTVFIKKPGGSDARFYTDKGMAAAVMGLQGGGIHGDEEYLELDSLERYQKTLRDFLQSLGAAT
jgi:succinyl-diaminopimelate desuccinylase